MKKLGFIICSFLICLGAANPRVYFAVDRKDDLIAVEVKITDVSESVFGAAFDVIFDPQLLEYVSYSPGSYLADPLLHLVHVGDGNRLITGISQRIDGQARGNTDTSLITYYFKKRGMGDVALRFENHRLIAHKEGVPFTIEPVSWLPYSEETFLETSLFERFRMDPFSEVSVGAGIVMSSLFGIVVLTCVRLIRRRSEIRQ